jgi:hypothetical protein
MLSAHDLRLPSAGRYPGKPRPPNVGKVKQPRGRDLDGCGIVVSPNIAARCAKMMSNTVRHFSHEQYFALRVLLPVVHLMA